MEAYFRELIRGVDASLLEEWERLKNPEWIAAAEGADKPTRPASYDITRDAAAFRRLVRAEIFLLLQGAARWAAGVDEEENEAQFQKFESFFEARGRFRLDPEGRAAKHTHFLEERGEKQKARGEIEVAQMLVDVEGLNDWEAVFAVLLTESRAENRAVVRLVVVRPVGAA